MPTGVEEVGFVLAAWPILFQLIDQYSDGIELIKKWIRYKREALRLQHKLGAQAYVFQNASGHFLQAVLGPASTRRLWNDSTGDLWRDPGIANAIKERLGERNWKAFEGILFEISETLSKLLHGLQRSLNINRSSPLHSSLSSLLARHRVVFRNREASLDQLHQDIEIYQNMIRNLHGVPTEDTTAIQDVATPNVAPLRRKASDLSQAIEKSLRCSCPVCHVAILRLDSSMSTLINQQEHHNKRLDDGAFHLDFRTARDWKSLAATIREEHATQCHTERIVDLCPKLIEGTNDLETLGCLGHATGPTCISIGVKPSQEGRSEVLTLHQVLSSDKRHTRFPFDTRDRLKLGLILAHSVLSLHSTPWLNDMWTSEDILFRPLAGDLDDDAVFQPYVMREFRESDQASPSPLPSDQVHNAALYALGKVFLQLIWNRPLLKQDVKDEKGLLATGDPEEKAAFELLKSVRQKAGTTWEAVIRRCLRCQFDVPTGSESLSNDDFLRKVYNGVITPLSDALKTVESV